MTAANRIPTPTGLVVTANKTGGVYLTWDDNAEYDEHFSEYHVYRGTENPPTDYIATTWNTRFWDLDKKQHDRYFYAVAAISRDVRQAPAQCEAVEVSIPLQGD